MPSINIQNRQYALYTLTKYVLLHLYRAIRLLFPS
jgi:hypothetical protein